MYRSTDPLLKCVGCGPLVRYLTVLTALVGLAAVPAVAEDGAALGSTWGVAAATARLPIVVLDASANALGRDAGAGRRIQGFSIGATISDPSLVSTVSFVRAGITSSLTPIFERQVADSGGSMFSWILTFDEGASPLPFQLDEGDLVGWLDLGISGQATPGDVITVALDAGASAIANQGGWLTSTGLSGLILEAGSVRVEETPLFADGFESGNTTEWSSTVP